MLIIFYDSTSGSDLPSLERRMCPLRLLQEVAQSLPQGAEWHGSCCPRMNPTSHMTRQAGKYPKGGVVL